MKTFTIGHSNHTIETFIELLTRLLLTSRIEEEGKRGQREIKIILLPFAFYLLPFLDGGDLFFLFYKQVVDFFCVLVGQFLEFVLLIS